MNYKNCSQLKNISRAKMLGSYGVAIGAGILIELINYLLNSVCMGAIDTATVMGMVMYVAIWLIISLIMSVFTVGEIGIYLKIDCGVRPGVSGIFEGFKKHPDKPILIRLVFAVLALLCFAVPMGLGLLYYNTSNPLHFLYCCITAVVGTTVYIYYCLTFGLSYYLIADYPQMEVSEALTKSRMLMEGHKLTLFGLYVSFIPLYALSVLTVFIGNLFITPYRKMAVTQFYLERAHHEDACEE